jgi:hypothetical protein
LDFRPFHQAALEISRMQVNILPAVQQMAEVARTFEHVHETLAGQVFQQLRAIAELRDSRDIHVPLENLATTVESHARSLRASPITQFGMLQVILTILLFLIQIGLSQQSEERLTRKFEEFQSRMLSAIEHLATGSEATLFQVKRRAIVRDTPSTSGRICAVLGEDTVVGEKSRVPGWVEIEYFDYSNGRSMTGWVSRRSLLVAPGRE